MRRGELVLGLIAAPDGRGTTLTDKYRDLSIAWSRYGYRDAILEGESIDAILSAAAAQGHRYCLVLAPGILIRESWRGDAEAEKEFHSALAQWIDENEFLVAGRSTLADADGRGLDDRCLLVDLERHRALGAPGVVEAALRGDIQVTAFDRPLREQFLDLAAPNGSRANQFARYLGEGISQYPEEREGAELTPDQRDLLDVVALHHANARRGVFLWNIESYEDVERPPPDFHGPVSRLYSVGAGFKPNRILETHGFDANSAVTFFDYSRSALDIRRFTLESWDGTDHPRFVALLFERFPYPDTWYHLWRDQTPEEVPAEDLEQVWARELARWGGEDGFARHWNAARALPHDFVHCDVVGDPGPLLERIEPDPGAVIWWSNAFFTVFSNWHYTWDERRLRYEAWVSQLASRNPDLLIYGSDHNNTNVNWIRVGDYWKRYGALPGDELVPRKLSQHEIRM